MSNFKPITAAQIGKFIQLMNGVSADVFHEHGFPLAHLLAEYLRQENPQPLSLVGARQMLRLHLKPDMVFNRVLWTKRIPDERLSEHAVRPSGQKQMWTNLVRLYPEDVGLVSEDVQPEDVFHIALQWGFNLIPREVFTALVRTIFPGQRQIGDLTAFIGCGENIAPSVLRIQNSQREWSVSQVVGFGMRRRLNLVADECWSILVAAETTEAK